MTAHDIIYNSVWMCEVCHKPIPSERIKLVENHRGMSKIEFRCHGDTFSTPVMLFTIMSINDAISFGAFLGEIKPFYGKMLRVEKVVVSDVRRIRME